MMRRITSKRGDEARKLMAEEDAGLRPKVRRIVMGDRERRAIDGIVIGDRHRKDLGDLAALAASVGKIGLLQAIGVTKSNELVFGERRLRACRDILGWKHIDVRVVTLGRVNLPRAEHDENELRKDFTPS